MVRARVSLVLRGEVLRVSRKPERAGERGLPKPAVPSATVTKAGVEGDFNRYRNEKKHGDPRDAILLYPLEMLERLREEGWPASPGDLGENLTTRGIAYDAFAPGTLWRVGADVVLRVDRACQPCKNLGVLPWVGPERLTEFIRIMRDRRGWYCSVEEAGRVVTGDAIKAV
jgi:MOSC domain-containing protein YiiM